MRAQLGRAALRLDPQSLRWLAAGEQGPSSLGLFVLLTGVRPRHYRQTAPALVHFSADKTEQYLLVRVNKPADDGDADDSSESVSQLDTNSQSRDR